MKSIFVSLIGHMAIFSIFSLSFGLKVPQANYANVYSWGGVLSGYNLYPGAKNAPGNKKNLFLSSIPSAPVQQGITGYYLKPQVRDSVFNQDKIIFSQGPALTPPGLKRAAQVVMLYPRLPYNFLLFFKDRQAAHIEVMFNKLSGDRGASLVTKRKISSGNLELDLLSMRYIGHYLFIELPRVTADNWQTIKIDLSAKND
ncbi:MAG TPA: hypothetical protein VI976_03645 [Candidatus Omnitrophota bacterium]|nr:hypothetical protein [Candidatus Omnitrophota bacterium]